MNTITLKETLNKTIFLTGFTPIEWKKLDKIEDQDILKDELKTLVKSSNAEVIMVGDISKYSINSHSEILDTIKNGDYRCYDVSLRQQEGTMSLVTLCPDPRTSWQSAIRAVGFLKLRGLNTPAYYETPCLLWETIKSK